MTMLWGPASSDAALTFENRPPVLDVVIPVHNEERDLEPCVRRLHAYLTDELGYAFRITVAENASSDGTVEVARRLAAELPGVTLLALTEPGRGRSWEISARMSGFCSRWIAGDDPSSAFLILVSLVDVGR